MIDNLLKKRNLFFFSRGFTLIEFTMIIAVIAILSVALAPRYFVVSTYTQQTYHDEVLNSFRYARKLSIETGSHIQVALTSNSITLLRRTVPTGCTNTTVALFDPILRTNSYVQSAPSGVTITFNGTNFPLYFNGLGQVFRASDCQPISSVGSGSTPGTESITVSGQSAITLWGETGFSQ